MYFSLSLHLFHQRSASAALEVKTKSGQHSFWIKLQAQYFLLKNWGSIFSTSKLRLNLPPLWPGKGSKNRNPSDVNSAPQAKSKRQHILCNPVLTLAWYIFCRWLKYKSTTYSSIIQAWWLLKLFGKLSQSLWRFLGLTKPYPKSRDWLLSLIYFCQTKFK